MDIVTRFAPSPTGSLHIGGARTALFNWLYARRHGGRFHLRIEDTDLARSTGEAKRAIVDGLSWLGLAWDGEAVHQSERRERHVEAAGALLAAGHAYRCYCTPEELGEMRQEAARRGRPARYDGRWRDRDPAEAPAGVPPVLRIRTPEDGTTVIRDLVQGRVGVDNGEIDDFVILRADGTPTYMLSVVVDDHDMGITHVIRGDDHFTNAFRQAQLFDLLGWDRPAFAHVPLIHGPDGKKLSKRHGALGVDAYREDGFLPEALRNYLVRLGWAHGDDEFIPTEQAAAWFDVADVGRSPARFDVRKLESLNALYLRAADDAALAGETVSRLEADGVPVDAGGRARILAGMPGLKERAKTLVGLARSAAFYARARPVPLDARAGQILDAGARELLGALADTLADAGPWSAGNVEARVRAFADSAGRKLGAVAQPLRAALTGAAVSPGIFAVMEVLGRDETLARIRDAAGGRGGA